MSYLCLAIWVQDAHNGVVRHIFQVIKHLYHPRPSNNHRPRVLHPLPVVVITLLLLGGGLLVRNLNSWGHILGYASSITPEQVVSQTNQERALKGLPPLTLSSTLSAAALAKGQDMFDRQYWAHTSPQGVEPWVFINQAGYSYRAAGENLARDFSTTDAMFKAWMGSPTHRANIVNEKYEEIGVAVIDGELEGYETTLVVQLFGSPKVKAAAIDTQALTDQQELRAVKQTGVTVGESEQDSVMEVNTLRSPAVLASFLVPIGELRAPLITPLQLSKAVVLAVVMMFLVTLFYDYSVANNRKIVRLVGKNLAHIFLFLTVAFVIIFFKGGLIN